MATTKKILAIDLGAESGRGILGHFASDRLELEVVHRFPNGGVQLPDGLYWNALRLFEEMKAALKIASAKHGGIDSVGVDTWGVDFALLGRNNVLLGNPRHYRDPHTETIMEESFRRVTKEEIFRRTGIQFMRFNTLFQLLAMQRDRSPLLDAAESLLFMPDLFHYWFTGEKANEFTIASTSQYYDPNAKIWATSLFDAFKLPKKILGDIVPAGAKIGICTAKLAKEINIAPFPVIAPASHDTGAAVAAVPAERDSWCYISSGTWSLMGAEIATPIINETSQKYNFTNEGGVGGTIRFLKNVMGLWLVQECRRSWEREGKSYSYDELTRMAEQAKPMVSLIDPDHASFILPESMPAAIADFCKRTGQPAPTQPGEFVRCVLESLALRYRWVLERLEEMLGRRLEIIHIVGGGSQNGLLSQLTADACSRIVVAGPVEATAIGNVLTQAMGLGLVGSLAEAREIVKKSFAPKKNEPNSSQEWNETFARFQQLIAKA